MFDFACFQSILNIYIKKPNIFPATRVGRVFKKDMQKRKAYCPTFLRHFFKLTFANQLFEIVS